MIVFIILFIISLLMIFMDYLERKDSDIRLKNIPIISKIPFVGSMLALISFRPDNLHLKFKEYCKRFGNTFYARVLGSIIVVTAEHRFVEPILNSQQHIHKHMLYYMLRPWLGDGLLLSTEHKWYKMRKIITPTFHFKILEEFIEVFEQQSTILVDKLKPLADGQAIIDIYPYLGLATMDIIAQTTMGVRINAQSATKSDFVNSVQKVTDILAKRFFRPLSAIPSLFRIITPTMYKQQNEGIEIMHNFTESVIEERRLELVNKQQNIDNPIIENDKAIKRHLALLDTLLSSKTNLTDREIRDEVNTIMFEGHDTTTSAISFCLYLLSRNPNCQQKLFEEINAHFQGDPEHKILFNDVQSLSYLNWVVKETLRLYPPIPAIGRLLKSDLNIGDVTLPAGTNVIILLWQILRDPDVFSDPDIFRPERYYQLNLTDMHTFSNIPFSAGPRNCIGQRFALLEIKTVVIKMLMHYELLPLGDDIQPSIHIVLRSKNGVNFGLRQR